MHPQRICVYPADVQLLTGKSERTARFIIRSARKKFNKEPGQFLTANELAAYTGIPLDDILRFLK